MLAADHILTVIEGPFRTLNNTHFVLPDVCRSNLNQAVIYIININELHELSKIFW